MGKKQRMSEQKSKLEKKAKTFKGARKLRYKSMSYSGELGKQELKKYRLMYDRIANIARAQSIPSVDADKAPTRRDYSSLRKLYSEQVYS